jgi:hypothetical protein
MAERLSMSGTKRQKPKRQTAAERQAVYDYVTARDGGCQAPNVEGERWGPMHVSATELICCEGRLERHHAGNTIGSARKTDARHVILLCKYHHDTWAPSHSREILAYLARIEGGTE